MVGIVTVKQKSTSSKFRLNLNKLQVNPTRPIIIIECKYGWQYDKTYYGETITSQENWVCKDEMSLTNFLMFGRIGEIVGTSIFAQMGDTYVVGI